LAAVLDEHEHFHGPVREFAWTLAAWTNPSSNFPDRVRTVIGRRDKSAVTSKSLRLVTSRAEAAAGPCLVEGDRTAERN